MYVAEGRSRGWPICSLVDVMCGSGSGGSSGVGNAGFSSIQPHTHAYMYN